MQAIIFPTCCIRIHDNDTDSGFSLLLVPEEQYGVNSAVRFGSQSSQVILQVAKRFGFENMLRHSNVDSIFLHLSHNVVTWIPSSGRVKLVILCKTMILDFLCLSPQENNYVIRAYFLKV